MATSPEKKVQPIVIKRIKKGGHGGHHGGAWKIAYADFVTAMMAFFLLMWLLGSTTKGDLQGISDYFNSPLKVALAGGSGSGDSNSVIQGGGPGLTRTVGQVKAGDIETTKRNERMEKAARAREEKVQLMKLADKINATIMADPHLAEFRNQIRLDMTPDGLRIQIVDAQNRPMFDSGSAVVKDYMRDLLRGIGRVLNDVPNRITLSGHTDTAPYAGGSRGYSNWELSADRANASRRELIAGGMQENKLLRVVGLAAALPMDPDHPGAAINRRISLTVMNSDAERRVLDSERIEVPSDADAADTAEAINAAGKGADAGKGSDARPSAAGGKGEGEGEGEGEGAAASPASAELAGKPKVADEAAGRPVAAAAAPAAASNADNKSH